MLLFLCTHSKSSHPDFTPFVILRGIVQDFHMHIKVGRTQLLASCAVNCAAVNKPLPAILIGGRKINFHENVEKVRHAAFALCLEIPYNASSNNYLIILWHARPTLP